MYFVLEILVKFDNSCFSNNVLSTASTNWLIAIYQTFLCQCSLLLKCFPVVFQVLAAFTYHTLCTIWYHLCNLKNVKNYHGGVLHLLNFTKSITSSWVFFTFLKLYKWYQIIQNITSSNNIHYYVSGTNGLVVRALDCQCRFLRLKTMAWLQDRISLSPVCSRSNEYQELLGTYW